MSTLKTIIEDKESELERMKKYIQDVKDEYLKKQTQDLNEIKRLNDIIFKQNLNMNAMMMNEPSFQKNNETSQVNSG